MPFFGLHDGAVIMEVAVHDKRPPWPGPSAVARGLTGDIWSVMQLCWKTIPTDRPYMPLVVSHLEIADLNRDFVDDMTRRFGLM